ncbi:MAG: DNA polymerase I [Bacteroidales bacterium]|nr:DNA polymerase I [Bacteroidales bacterium]
MEKLFLLDGMALIYRAFFAMQRTPRYNSKGLNTSAIMGFANTLYELLKNEKPTHIGVAFDTQAPTARHTDFVQYKANRQAMPEDLAASIPYIKELIRAFNIPTLYVEGYEADDVIGTLAKEAEQAGYQVFMVTPDKDFGQLVSENIFMYKPAKAGERPVIMGVPEVCEKFGIKNPLQVIDFLGLMGDASDNIPGIPGVGEVTARKLLEEYGSVENLLENAKYIKNDTLRNKVENGRESAIISKQLATIILDVPIEFNETHLHLDPPDVERLKTLLDELEFRTFAQRVFTDLSLNPGGIQTATATKPSASKSAVSNGQGDLFSIAEVPFEPHESSLKTIENTPHEYRAADNESLIKELLNELENSESFCFDTETTGLDTITAELVGMSFATTPGKAWYVPVSENREEANALVARFKSVFSNPAIGKTAQNMKFDIAILGNYGIEIAGPTFDTMLAHYLIEPDMRHNMDLLAQTYLNYSPVSIEELIGKKGKLQTTMRSAPLEQIKEYAAEDADITLQLRNILEPKLKETDTLKIFNEIEMPLVPVLAGIEAAGVKLDSKALNEFSKELHQEIIKVQEEIWQHAGVEFNIASPKQLGEILFDRLKIDDKPKKTATKQYQTGEDVLQKLIHKHPMVQLILDFRGLSKLKSTYVDALPLLVNPVTGRIHTSYNQAVAATGRLSSTNPNLQNIPIRTERGREIRKAFVPRNEEYTLLSADYSQIELRIIASMSNDEAMKEAFRQGLDIHTATAANIYKVSLDQVDRDMRRNAKSVNFGIVYGISAFGLSENLGIPRKEAAEIIDTYFATFPGIKKFMDGTLVSAREKGYVETLMGRRRIIRDINSANGVMRGFAERNAINAPIQGSAADMIKIAMINIYNEFQKRKLQSRMTMQVHDELVFDVYKPEVDQVKQIVGDLMRTALPLDVPVEVEMNTGDNWLAAH